MKLQIIKVLSLLLAASTLTSCLKDDRLVLDPEKGTNVIEFANPAQINTIGSVYPLYNFAYDIVPSATIPITISYSGPATGAPQDITVNFVAGTQTEVDQYNEDQETGMVVLDATLFKLSTNTVTIKKGQTKASFNVVVSPDKFDFSKDYALPLKITTSSVGAISGNFGTILLKIGAKNKYDGVYRVEGTMVDRNSAANVGSYPREMSLVTQSLNSNALFDQALNGGSFFHHFLAGTSGSYYGNFAPIFTFSDAGIVNEVVNYYGQGSNSSVRAAKLDPTGVNKYDPASKTLEVSYIMVQAGVERVFFKEKWTYLHAR
jgi:hypothetical protein